MGAMVWSFPRCTTAAVCLTPKSRRSPSRRLRPSRLSWPTPAPLPQLLHLPPPLLLLQLLPPRHRRRRARRRMTTWASASSTNLCHLLDDCRSFVNFQFEYYRCIIGAFMNVFV